MSEGNDLIEDFRFSENDLLALPIGMTYDLYQEGNNLQLSTLLGSTTIWSVDLETFAEKNRIISI